MSDSQEKTDQNTTDDQHHHCHHVKDDEPTPIKAQAVLASAEIGRMTDLGLGRGVDATDPRPWLDKSSFQVRRVAIDSVIGTEEGGSVMSFATSVSSVVNQQGEFKASVAVPRSPITVGVDAELSRGNNTTRRSIGRKVVNRTVSFREDFEDTVAVSSTPEEAVQEASAVATKSLYTAVGEVSDSRISDASSGTTFQERLARWIVERILHREKIIELELGMKGKPPPIKRVTFSGDPEDDLAEYIHKSTADERKLIVKDCHDFVNHFHITHYVCAIQLGASEYRVLDESDYFTALSTVGSLGLETLTTVALTGKSSKKVTMKASEKKSIGTISKNGTVARGSYNEAVVGVSFRPITSLLKLRYLYLSMRKALLDYMGSQADTTSGPFLIAADADKLFWMVNPNNGYSVEGTRDIQRASPFYILPMEDSHPYDFVIAYQGEEIDEEQKRSKQTLTVTGQRPLEPVSRYLLTPVGMFGRNPGPLRLHYHAQESHSRLILHGRLTKGGGTVDLTEWVNGKDIFFMQCAHRFAKRDGFVCVKAYGHQPNVRYSTACVARKSDHNDRDTWMLFRLMPLYLRTSSSTSHTARASADGDEDAELEEYDRVLGVELGDDTLDGPASPGSARPLIPLANLDKPLRGASRGTLPGSRAMGDSTV